MGFFILFYPSFPFFQCGEPRIWGIWVCLCVDGRCLGKFFREEQQWRGRNRTAEHTVKVGSSGATELATGSEELSSFRTFWASSAMAPLTKRAAAAAAATLNFMMAAWTSSRRGRREVKGTTVREVQEGGEKRSQLLSENGKTASSRRRYFRSAQKKEEKRSPRRRVEVNGGCF